MAWHVSVVHYLSAHVFFLGSNRTPRARTYVEPSFLLLGEMTSAMRSLFRHREKWLRFAFTTTTRCISMVQPTPPTSCRYSHQIFSLSFLCLSASDHAAVLLAKLGAAADVAA